MTTAIEPIPMWRQGDVLLHASVIPSTAILQTRLPGALVLQHGKATGHSHQIASLAASLYADGDRRFLRAAGSETEAPFAVVELTHEEHRAISIPPGDYEITIHAEYVPGEPPVNVED